MARTKQDTLTGTQRERYDNLSGRILDKITGTFGTTAENVNVRDMPPGDYEFEDEAGKLIEIESRGVVYSFILLAGRELS